MKINKNLNNQEVSKLFKAVAAAYEVKQENDFKIRAYQNAADSIDHANREIKDLWESGKLRELPGVGSNMASHLNELFSKGKVKHFDQVFKDLPMAMFELIQVPGIGSKSAYKLCKELGIKEQKNAISKLKALASEGKLRRIEGFAEESEKAIIKGIDEYQRRENRMLLPTASRFAKEIVNYLQKNKNVHRIVPLGSLRRRCATVGDIDIAVSTRDAKSVIDHFKKFPKAKRILAAGKNTARLLHRSGRQIDLKTTKPESFGSLLQHFTGSKSHNIKLRELAMEKGLSLSEHGIKINRKIMEYDDEQSFYKALELDWIPPELREDNGEIKAAAKGALPKLVKHTDIKGDLHIHTNHDWQSSHDSGSNSIKQMAEKAIELGFSYLGVGDHNPSTSSYSKKEAIEEIKKRSHIIENIKYSFENSEKDRAIYILNTLEVDILANGSLAIPDEALELLDYAVVSVHSGMRISKEKMTARIIKGLSHRKAKILGHPTGRLLNKREGYEADWEKIFDFAKDNSKFIEINSWPSRLDLTDGLVRQAVNFGVKLVINSDSHEISHMELINFGVDVARRGWATKKDILNTYDYKKLENFLLK